MFGRGRETLASPEPTIEEPEQLIEAALARIETVDNIDHLDGYALPPDNDELWAPGLMIKTSITYLSDKPYIRESERQLSLTNHQVRDTNIRCIATSGRPLILKWEEIDVSGLRYEPREGLISKIGRIVNGIWPKN